MNDKIAKLNSFLFQQFTADELYRCGDSFLDHFQKVHWTTTSQRTTAILEWFRNTIQCDDHYIYSRLSKDAQSNKRYKKGEFLYDLSAVRTLKFPPSPDVFPLKADLVLESEWGVQASAPATFREVLHDASKLVIAKSSVKILLFAKATTEKQKPSDLANAVVQLKEASGDITPWLIIYLPWNIETDIGRFGVIEKEGTQRGNIWEEAT